jgi:hypothetical protein
MSGRNNGLFLTSLAIKPGTMRSILSAATAMVD